MVLLLLAKDHLVIEYSIHSIHIIEMKKYIFIVY